MTDQDATRGDEGGRAPLHAWDYWRIVYDGRRMLGTVLGVTLAVALVGTLLLPDRYRAEALVELDLRQATILGTESERGAARTSFYDLDRQFHTEFIKLGSRELLAHAVEEHGLREKVPALARMKDPVKVLQSRVGVDTVPQSNVLKISLWWTDPEVSALLTNAVTDTYMHWDLDERTAVLRSRAERLKVSAEEKKGLRRRIVEHELAVIRERPPVEQLLELGAFEDNATLEALHDDLSEVERDLEGLRQSYGPNHEVVRAKVAQRDELRAQEAEAVAAVQRALEDELVGLGGDPAKVARQELPKATAEAEAELKFGERIMQTLEEHLVQAHLVEPKVKIIQRAEPPSGPYAPKLGLNLALALVVGLAFGGGLVFFRDFLDSSVRTIEDVERVVGLNLLAVVPAGTGADRVRLEAFQTLRTGLLFASAGRRDRILLVSSAAPQEGKSNVVASLATSLAASGESVVVLECDLRRPGVSRLLGVSGQSGLTNYLADESQRDWKRFATEVKDRLTVIPAGPVPPNPLDLLGLPRFADLLKQLKGSFDWVVMDSPPVSSVSDGIVLASLTEMVLFVIRHDHTDREVVRRAVSRVQAVGARVVGAVLNDVDMSKSYNREYYYGRYYYGQYYGEGEQGGTRPGLFGSLVKRSKVRDRGSKSAGGSR